jgi:hypothetical protein
MLHEVLLPKKKSTAASKAKQTKHAKKRSQISARVINLHCIQPQKSEKRSKTKQEMRNVNKL